MTIILPDEWRERLETRAKTNGFASVEEYILNLAEAEESKGEPFPDLSGPFSLTPRNRAELEAMLDEGMASGNAVEADDAFWAERRRIMLEKLATKTEAIP